MNLLRDFQNLITEHGSSLILRERLLLFVDKVAQLEEKCRDLEKKLCGFRAETAQLRKELKEKTVRAEFTEHRGALFKRNKFGTYDPTVFCPSCRMPISSFGGEVPYNCAKCGVVLDFDGHDMPKILKELAKTL